MIDQLSGSGNTSAAGLGLFRWEPQPAAQKLVDSLVAGFLSKCDVAAAFAQRLKREAGTRFGDIIDHIVVPRTNPRVAELDAVGFRANRDGVYQHLGGIFPEIVIGDRFEISLRVESVADFLAANGIDASLVGPPLGSIRRATIHQTPECVFSVIERHGVRGMGVREEPVLKRMTHLEAFRTRRREFGSDDEGFAHAHRLIDAAIGDLGVDLTCDVFFAAEREFWQRRNTAAKVQKARQDVLGIGWANHDHHTYRSSRKNFGLLVSVWEKLGFVMRERFYAGSQAGWGAQVMEQPVARIVTFNDVDLSSDELRNDFSHEPLAERDSLGTVGLWCGLHGDSFLQAGMHHLECQFDFESLKEQLDSTGIVKVMKPFTDFPYLRQAFTEGERWTVKESRIVTLLSAGLITEAQAQQFREQGAIGSHLENLERNDGFKGFNQEGVSEIIAATDPRKQAVRL